MRVLIVHSRYRSGWVSGENRVVADEIKLLRSAGHAVHTVILDPSVDSRLERLRTGITTTWSSLGAHAVSLSTAQHHPEVVHIHNLFPAVSPSVLYATNGAPIVGTLHNYRHFCLPGTLVRNGHMCEDCLGHAPWRGVVRSCYRSSIGASASLATSLLVHRRVGSFSRVRLWVAVSEFVRHKYAEAGYEASKMVVKPHFAWPSRLRVGPGKYFVFLGRVVREKGILTLLSAWRDTYGQLLIIGDGPSMADARSIAPRSVRFLGSVRPKETRDLIAGARAVVVPSESPETFGKVVVESYASGVPVIGTDVGALPEVIRGGSTGILVPPGDPNSLADAVQRLLDDTESQRMGAEAFRAWESRYSPEVNLPHIEDIYRRVQRTPGPQP